MSTVSNVGSGSSTGASGSSGYSAMTAQDFTKIIFAELSKQDPQQPNDTNALLQQITSIRNLQSNIDLTDSLKQLTGENSFASAANMIGKTVTGFSDNFDEVSGVVKSVSRTNDGVVLTLKDGTRVPMSQLEQIDQTATGG